MPIFTLVPLSLAYGSDLRSLILKEPQCGNIGKQIESTLNCEKPLVWPPAAKTPDRFNFFDYRSGSAESYPLLSNWANNDVTPLPHARELNQLGKILAAQCPLGFFILLLKMFATP